MAVIYAGPGRFSRRGRGLGGDRRLPAVAGPRASPCPHGLGNLFPHSATRRPAATFLEKNHTCAYCSLWRRGELRSRGIFCSSELLANPPIPELARKCRFHLLIALGTSIPPPHQVVVHRCVGIFLLLLNLHPTNQQLTAGFRLRER